MNLSRAREYLEVPGAKLAGISTLVGIGGLAAELFFDANGYGILVTAIGGIGVLSGGIMTANGIRNDLTITE